MPLNYIQISSYSTHIWSIDTLRLRKIIFCQNCQTLGIYTMIFFNTAQMIFIVLIGIMIQKKKNSSLHIMYLTFFWSFMVLYLKYYIALFIFFCKHALNITAKALNNTFIEFKHESCHIKRYYSLLFLWRTCFPQGRAACSTPDTTPSCHSCDSNVAFLGPNCLVSFLWIMKWATNI